LRIGNSGWDDRMTSSPAISVIIPAYNKPEPLRATLDALAAQTLPKSLFEVIVVDDGSPTTLADVCGAAQGKLNLQYVRVENGGPGRARDIGAARSRGEYVAFTDHDCRPVPTWLAAYASAFQDEPRLLFGGRTINGLTANIFSEAHESIVEYVQRRFHRGTDQPFFPTNNLALRRDAFLEMNGFGGQLRWAHEERDLADRWRKSGGGFRYVESAVVVHCHEFNLVSFLRHHYSYGAAVADFHDQRRSRGDVPFRFAGIGFHAGLVTYPLRNHPVGKGIGISAAIVLSQAAYLSGFVRSLAAKRWRPARAAPY
jgi:glycosyltransferase involved in cell wall biosynthesis